jgi:hypothetical protein
MWIFPGNKLFDTHSRINDDLKRGISAETLQAATRIFRYNHDTSPEFYHPTMTHQLFQTEYHNY